MSDSNISASNGNASGAHAPQGRLLHEMIMPVRWGDMDALGHVNNIMYFRYFESVRLDWLQGLDYSTLGTGDDGFVIVDNHAEYLLPVVYPSTARVQMGAHSAGRSSFETTYTLCVGDKLMTRGSSKVVWIDSRTMKSTPLPDKVRQLVEPATD